MEELGSNYLVLPSTLTRSNISMHFYTLINSGGSTINFIDTKFVIACCFPFEKLEKPLILNIVDRQAIVSG